MTLEQHDDLSNHSDALKTVTHKIMLISALNFRIAQDADSSTVLSTYEYADKLLTEILLSLWKTPEGRLVIDKTSQWDRDSAWSAECAQKMLRFYQTAEDYDRSKRNYLEQRDQLDRDRKTRSDISDIF